MKSEWEQALHRTLDSVEMAEMQTRIESCVLDIGSDETIGEIVCALEDVERWWP